MEFADLPNQAEDGVLSAFFAERSYFARWTNTDVLFAKERLSLGHPFQLCFPPEND